LCLALSPEDTLQVCLAQFKHFKTHTFRLLSGVLLLLFTSDSLNEKNFLALLVSYISQTVVEKIEVFNFVWAFPFLFFVAMPVGKNRM